jgi:serine/threonine protein phosphatase 1
VTLEEQLGSISNGNHHLKYLLTAIANANDLSEIGTMQRLIRRLVENWPWRSTKKRPPSIPAGTRIYAIGDVHGRIDLLNSLLERIDKHLAAFPIERSIHVFIGDYIDRGPDSRNVLDCLIARSRTHELICLKGNHEAFILQFLEDPTVFDDWRRWGGIATLLSYGVTPPGRTVSPGYEKLAATLRQIMPEEHRSFLANLATTFTWGDYFFVHAGVRPGVRLSAQVEQDLLFIREEFLSADTDFGKMIIHGHTPVREVDIRRNRINIDTGAYATGKLTCLIIEGEDLFFI